jgi:hypothetical protein
MITGIFRKACRIGSGFRQGMGIMAAFLCLASCAGRLPNPEMVADQDPIAIGTVKIGFRRPFSSNVEQKNVAATWDPRTNRLILQFAYQAVTYRQYWDRSARALFIEALRRYQADYSTRELSSKSSSRTRRLYGSQAAMIEWGHFISISGSRAYPRLDLGYMFHGVSPYFTVTQNSAKNVVLESTDNVNESLTITMYFTRTMAESLAAVFDEAQLHALLGPSFTPPPGEVIPDSYDDEAPLGDEECDPSGGL